MASWDPKEPPTHEIRGGFVFSFQTDIFCKKLCIKSKRITL